MNNIQLALFDYGSLDSEARIVVQQEDKEFDRNIGDASISFIRACHNLSRIHEVLKYSRPGFTDYCKTKQGLSNGTAYRMIDVAKMFPNLGNIDIAPSALYLLASPSLPEQARQEAIGRAQSGEIITYSKAQEIVIEHQDLPSLSYDDDKETPDDDGLIEEYDDEDIDEVSSVGTLPTIGEQPSMPSKEYHAANRTVGDQFHSKLIWNYSRINLDFWQCFTIGYSQRTWEQVAELLELAKVSVLMDVRKSAISQYKPEFNKQQLSYSCSNIGIRYIHVPELGVEYEDRAELSETHDYATLFDTYEERLTPEGIIEAIKKWVDIGSHRIAFMCVEIDPATCHRNRIAKALEERGIAKTFDL